ncbi:hypothetical protein M407DRAFT_11776 [Tulasnella calospora MUT 4182]|uniref:BTB domain-containing protein n=1 Tax=Tulasnella calospora MUT 4182 TaxID=1051891 RepID=A0A0C3Q571_9AGAM|nr:hypothetical protein M407DRAFT_11776 [Tulasnella calospora MUT 4182]
MASSSPAPDSHDQTSINIARATYTRHRTHWYTDGNLVILVDKVAFRVFQSFLTRRSTVLELLLTRPAQPEDLASRYSSRRSQETVYDGASVIRLDDSAGDVGLLLDVILPQSYTTSPISPRTGCFRLLGLAQIAQKYAVSDVLSQVLAVLEEVLPTVQRPHRVKSPVEAAIIIHWARNCNFHQFLPMAFYYLATGEWQDNAVGSRAMASLSTRDQLRAQQGLTRLQAIVIRLAMPRWENHLIGESKPKKGCPDGRYTCWMGYGGKVWPSGDNEARWTNLLVHPLEELRMRVDHEVAALHHLCDSCRDEFTSFNRLMIGDIVQELGSLFTFEDESFPFGVGP